MLQNVNIEGKETVLLGDLNCDYLKEHNNRSLKNILMGQGFSQNIAEATRVTKESKSLILMSFLQMPAIILLNPLCLTVV